MSALVPNNVTKWMCEHGSLWQPKPIDFVPPEYISASLEESRRNQSKIKIGPGVEKRYTTLSGKQQGSYRLPDQLQHGRS